MVTLGATLSATMGMVDRVHCDPPHTRALPEPAGATSLAYRNILMIDVADLTDSCTAFCQNHALLAGW
jgi:hypothetical protein